MLLFWPIGDQYANERNKLMFQQIILSQTQQTKVIERYYMNKDNNLHKFTALYV